MSKLIDELMAEMNRVKNLETEVNTTVKQLDNETRLAREEKQEQICQFLMQMTDLLLNAKVIRPANDSACQYYSAIVNPGIRFQNLNGGACYSLKLAIYGNEVAVKHYQESHGETLIYKGHPYSFLTDHVKHLIDCWSQATYDAVENQVAEIVKKAIAKRIEEATQKLNQANNKYNEYFGEEK